ncbi:SDR family NAD(P)-dependent oxidoreductase [Alkalicaulis satelles]|uniref:SDR family NAD(P)-dependent oxidoreductase n=1 Tax=Alkalicaulis satelles TaxID=2609175 RepID=A0A5M6ZSV0_9PROT|nr:SDR family NAD(P)-dependent oxidoreductase [Alkalicaulis satelles]KAA5805401.1 SDR family NAD(P)-dependent oxidoreductase [Alkalicaulis satelles]
MSLSKTINFYGRFLIPFSRLGFMLKGLNIPEQYDGLEGRTVLITGATGGIGAAMALGVARSGGIALAAGRSDSKLADLVAQAKGLAGRVEPLKADLSLASDTLALADMLAARPGGVDALINNVGVLNHAHEATGEGIDAMYAVNILNPFILTEALMASGALKPGGCVVNMASGGMYNAPQNLVYMEQKPEGYNGFAAYATHKRAQLVLSDGWAARGYAAWTMHPGWVDTDGVKRSLPKFRKVLKSILRNEDQGADTALWLISARPAPQAGALWFDRAPRPAHAFKRTRTPLASDADIRAKLETGAAALKTRLQTGDAS